MNSHERQDTISTLAELIKEIRIAMLTTVTADGSLRSRPMISVEPEFGGDLWFFTLEAASKVEEVEQHLKVNVSFASPEHHRYVSLSGSAQLVHDERKTEILWKPEYGVWFPEDVTPADLCFLKVEVDHAEYWDGSSSRMVQVADFAKTIFGSQPSRSTDHQEIDWPAAEATAGNSKEEEDS